MFDFNNIDLETLKKMRECIINYSDISSLLLDIDYSISEKEEEMMTSLNVRFNMEMFIKLEIFTPDELKVIRDNNINNLKELIDCDLNELIGITPSIKYSLLQKRRFYDMDGKRHK